MQNFPKEINKEVKEYSRRVTNKFPPNKESRELREVLIATKIYKIENIIYTVIHHISKNQIDEIGKLDIEDEEAINVLVTNIADNIRFPPIVIKDKSLNDKVIRVMQKIYRAFLLMIMKDHPDRRTKIINAIKGIVEDRAYIDGVTITNLDGALMLDTLPKKYFQDQQIITLQSTAELTSKILWIKSLEELIEKIENGVKDGIIKKLSNSHEELARSCFCIANDNIKSDKKLQFSGTEKQMLIFFNSLIQTECIDHKSFDDYLLGKIAVNCLNKKGNPFLPSQLKVTLSEYKISPK